MSDAILFPRRRYTVCTSIYTVGTWHQSWLMSLRWWREAAISHRYTSSCLAARSCKYCRGCFYLDPFWSTPPAQRRAARLWITHDTFSLGSARRKEISLHARAGSAARICATSNEVPARGFAVPCKLKTSVHILEGAITTPEATSSERDIQGVLRNRWEIRTEATRRRKNKAKLRRAIFSYEPSFLRKLILNVCAASMRLCQFNRIFRFINV